MKTGENSEKDYREFRDPDWPKGLHRRSSGKYFWRRMIFGQRRFKALGTRNLTFAIKMACDINESVEDKKLPIDNVVSKKDLIFSEAAREYLDSRQIKPSTAKRYRIIIRHIDRVFENIYGKPKILLTEINDQMVSKYIAFRAVEKTIPNGHPNTRKSRQGASPKSIAEERHMIVCVLRYAVNRKWLMSMPHIEATVKGVGSKGNASNVARPLEEDEIPIMLQAASKYDNRIARRYPYKTYFHDIIATYIYSGLRYNELRFLEWSDVNLKSELISVRSKKVHCRRSFTLSEEAWAMVRGYLRGKTKNLRALPDDPEVLNSVGYLLNIRKHEVLRSLRVKDFDPDNGLAYYEETLDWSPKATEGDVVLHPKLKEILGKLKKKAKSNFVFPDPDGGYWRMQFRAHLLKISAIAGIPDFTRIHDLRHTTGAMLRRKGVALETIKEILRHKNIQDTLIYARYELKEGREAIRKLPSW